MIVYGVILMKLLKKEKVPKIKKLLCQRYMKFFRNAMNFNINNNENI